MRKLILGVLLYASLFANHSLAAERNEPQPQAPKVIVIGGGVSGLTAAYRLREKGIDVELYEAKKRVGGRVFTVRLQGQTAELGAQNLSDGGKAENLTRLIEELGLEVDQREVSLNDYHCIIDGRPQEIPPRLEKRQFRRETLRKELEEIASHSKNMREVLSRLFDEQDPLHPFFSVRLAAYEGAVCENLSTRYITTLYYMLLGGLSPAYGEGPSLLLKAIRGGNSRIAESLAAALEGRIHLNKPLVAVSRSGDRYELAFRNGEKKWADILLLTAPCPIYEDIEFGAGVIPEGRLSGIRSIRNGTNGKILVHVPSRENFHFVNDRLVAYLDTQKRILNLHYTGKTGGFSAATVGDTYSRDRAQIASELKTAISSATPQMAGDQPFVEYGDSVGYSWLNDPFAKGSYSYIAPGQEALLTSLEEVEGETVKSLFAPIERRLFFAGEHTSVLLDASGTVEAACESGEKAARMIEKAISKERIWNRKK